MLEKNPPIINLETDVLPSDLPENETLKKLTEESYKAREEAASEYMKKYAPKFVIRRKQRELVDKMQPLWKFEKNFIQEQEARRNSPKTVKHYEQTFRVFNEFLAFFYAKSTDDISKIYEQAPDNVKNPLAHVGSGFPVYVLDNQDIQHDFGDYLTEVREVGEQTVLSYFRDFRAFMYYAMDCGYIDRWEIKVKDTEPPIKEVYTDREIKALLRAPLSDGYVENRDWAVVNYLLGTGNRESTIVSLKVGDIDLEEGYVNINTQKNRKATRQGLPSRLVTILDGFIKDFRSDEDGNPLKDNYLFATKYGEKMTRQGLYKSIANYNRARGVDKSSIHLFRHTFAKLWVLDDGDILSLQKALGHSNVKMAQRYANLYAQDVKDKIEKHSALSQQRVSSGKTVKKKAKK